MSSWDFMLFNVAGSRGLLTLLWVFFTLLVRPFSLSVFLSRMEDLKTFGVLCSKQLILVS
jgi:hypothetical protein